MAPRRKKIVAVVKVQLNAGAATPAPPVGTALGPHGVNIMDFCKQYNAATESMRGTSTHWNPLLTWYCTWTRHSHP